MIIYWGRVLIAIIFQKARAREVKGCMSKQVLLRTHHERSTYYCKRRSYTVLSNTTGRWIVQHSQDPHVAIASAPAKAPIMRTFDLEGREESGDTARCIPARARANTTQLWSRGANSVESMLGIHTGCVAK